jgi:uncharacterized SAM-binding protein YcdF (DUF218 family)
VKKLKYIILSFLLLFIILFLNAGKFYDVSTNPTKSDILVSLGGDNGNRIKKTLELYENNLSISNKIIITGVDNFDSKMKLYELDWRASYLMKNGIKENDIILNSQAQNTFEEMKFIKQYLIAHNMKKVLLITDPPHSRRILFFANTVLKYSDAHIELQIVGSENDWWNAKTYYTNPEAIIFVINESIKYSYYYIQYLLGNLHE